MDREHWTAHRVSLLQTWRQEIRDTAVQVSTPDQAKQTGCQDKHFIYKKGNKKAQLL